ncbi:MAG: hypothetical protein FWH28_02350 [Clostridiales bacterium]|nr:hypothetical protein [Clostridiales bacterium]
MKIAYEDLGVQYGLFLLRLEEKWISFCREERGDLVSSLGWMAIMALVLVMIKGLVDGKLVGYVNGIFVHLDKVFNP